MHAMEKANMTSDNEIHHATDVITRNYHSEKMSDSITQSFSEEEYLRIITDSDTQFMNEKIKMMYNKRDSILQSLEGKTIQITALNVDIVNSSAKVKTLSSQEAGEYYQAFIESTSELIQDYGGYVLKNVGDCVIGFFPCSRYMVENHEKAVLCGLAMFDKMKNSLNPYLVERKMPAIECRVSADFGPVQVLRIRTKDGYSAIDLFGSAMNTAAKISNYTKPGQMVIGDNLFWRLIDIDIFEFKLVHHWDLRGKYSYPVYVVERKRS